jgi:TRAP-type C4-dicarboxylate transport system substrate-binding protein
MVAVGSFCAVDQCGEIGLLETPFLFTSTARGRSAIDGPIGDEYVDLLRARDIHVVAWLENGLRQLTANRPIRTPADLAGLKLRVPQSPIAAEGFSALGATVTQVPFLRLYAALRGQVLEAQENPIAIIQFERLYEVQAYLSLTRHSYSTAMIVAAGDLLSDLSAAQHVALRHCGEWATNRSREVSDAVERDGQVWLAARGMMVIDDVDTVGFTAKARRVIDGLRTRYSSERIERLIRAAG